jgi:hypothetical protein
MSFRLALGPTSLISSGYWEVKQPDHSTPTRAEVKETWIYISTPQASSWCRNKIVKYINNLTFIHLITLAYEDITHLSIDCRPGECQQLCDTIYVSCVGSPVQRSVPHIVEPSARHSLLQALSHEVQVPSPSCLMEGLFHFFCLTLHWNNATLSQNLNKLFLIDCDNGISQRRMLALSTLITV